MSLFEHYVGIDYSGAQTPDTPLPGLRVYASSPSREPEEIRSPHRSSGHWTRRELSDWLIAYLRHSPSTLTGIDHGFSFPNPYFATHGLARDWRAALADFCEYWPADRPGSTVRQLRDQNGKERGGDSRWRRGFESYCGAKSIFHFDVPGSVAHSTHAGLIWLYRLLRAPGLQPHVWPFDGWLLPARRPVLTEVYPALCSGHFPRHNRTGDQHDAYSVCAWFRQLDRKNMLPGVFSVPSGVQVATARYEGWIPGLSDALARRGGPLNRTTG